VDLEACHSQLPVSLETQSNIAIVEKAQGRNCIHQREFRLHKCWGQESRVRAEWGVIEKSTDLKW